MLHAQESASWYRSNQAGMALEPVPSRVVALRNEYCLSVEKALPAAIPGILLPHYDESFTVELRTLYEKGQELRRQWLFRDSLGFVRLTASGSRGFFEGKKIAVEKPGKEETSKREAVEGGLGEEEPVEEEAGEGIAVAEEPVKEETGDENSEEESGTGFIEIRDGGGSITREFRFEEDKSEWDFRFFFNKGVLLSAETWFKAAPPEHSASAAEEPVYVLVSTDYYRYSRAGSIRAIDRSLHEGAGRNLRLGFPRIGTSNPFEEEFTTHGIAYTSDFLQDIFSPEGTKISYTFDSRGRILSEVWKDEDETVIGEFRNTWSGDRLGSVLWKSGNEERLVDYEYDEAGNRTAEQNFRNGELERTVRSSGDRDTEEIYINGRLVLRAVWEKGTKISEEWVSAGGRIR